MRPAGGTRLAHDAAHLIFARLGRSSHFQPLLRCLRLFGFQFSCLLVRRDFFSLSLLGLPFFLQRHLVSCDLVSCSFVSHSFVSCRFFRLPFLGLPFFLHCRFVSCRFVKASLLNSRLLRLILAGRFLSYLL